MKCQLVFNTWESRAFIAKTIINYSPLNSAIKEGVVAIGRGITNAFIVREILSITGNLDFQIDLDNYVAGVVDGSLWASNKETRTPEVAFYQGEPKFEPVSQSIKKCDIVLKGANALGPDWIAGVLCAHPTGGTIGSIYSTAIARGIPIIVPMSIEKMVPYPISEIIPNLGGQNAIDYSRGLPVSLFPIIGGDIFTEIEAVESIASDVDVFPIGASGVYNGAGATIFELSGDKTEVEKILKIFKEIKETKPLNINLNPH